MKTQSHLLLDDLRRKQEVLLDLARKKFVPLSEEELNWKHNPGKWSIAECLEHLNLYGEHYLPELAKAIGQGVPIPEDHPFQSSRLGNYFAESVRLKQGKLKKTKTDHAKNPVYFPYRPEVVARFVKQQEQYQELIQQARGLDLQKGKIPTAYSGWIRLSIGDTLRFVVYHNQRHVWQASNMLDRVAKLVLAYR